MAVTQVPVLALQVNNVKVEFPSRINYDKELCFKKKKAMWLSSEMQGQEFYLITLPDSGGAQQEVHQEVFV